MNSIVTCPSRLPSSSTIHRLASRIFLAAGLLHANSLTAQTAQNFPDGISVGTNQESYFSSYPVGETRESTILGSSQGGIALYSPWSETVRGNWDGGVQLFGKPISMVLGADNELTNWDKGTFDIWRHADYWSGGPQALPAFRIDTASNLASFNGLSIAVAGGTLTVSGSPVITETSAQIVLEGQGFVKLSNGILNLANTTVSSSSTTGALTVAGGIGIAKDSWINGVRVGRGKGLSDIITLSSTALGQDALQANGSGKFNTAVGARALSLNISGSYNTAVGSDTMKNNTSGYNNTSMGYGSLSANSTGMWNTAQGYNAMRDNINGQGNVAMGGGALQNNTSGNYNTALGVSSNLSNTTGFSNSTVGCAAMLLNTTGMQNAAIGAWSLYGNTTGSSNTAIGFNAGRYQEDGTTTLETANNSVYIGADSRGKDNMDDNSIVIGSYAVGEGANTTVIGNSNTVSSRLFGQANLDSLRVSGQVIIEQAQGDISMGIYGN